MPDKGNLLELCRLGDVPPGTARRVDLGAQSYAVFNLDGRLFVTQNDCTHGAGSLGDSFIDGEEVECEFHGGRFHIPSGKPTLPPCIDPLETWEAVVVGDTICIDPAAGRTADKE